MTKSQPIHLKTWTVTLGLAVLVFAMVLGFSRTANLVGTDLHLATGPLRIGTVAGATVDVEPGDVSIRVQTGTQTRTYAITIEQALSPFNVLRLADERTLLDVTFDAASTPTQLLQVDGTPATFTSAWQVSINGNVLTSLDAPLVVPGMTLTLSRT